MSTVAAVLLGKERRMVAKFEAAGAIDREHARTLDDVGVSRGLILRRLRERAVIRDAGGEHYYLDVESWAAVRRGRRRAIHVAAAVALALLLAAIFGARRAHALDGSTREDPNLSICAGLDADRDFSAGLFSLRAAPGLHGSAFALFGTRVAHRLPA